MNIALVTDVKQQAISLRVIDTMDRNRKLDRAEVGSKMTARSGDVFHQKRADFFA